MRRNFQRIARLAVARRCVLDRRRPGRQATRGWGCGRVALGIEVHLAGAVLLRARPRPIDACRTGTSMAATWPNAARCSSSSRSANRCSSAARRSPSCLDRAVVAAFAFAFLGAVAMWWLYFDKGLAAGAPPHRACATTPAATRASPTPTCTCRSWPASSCAPSPTSSCWRIPITRAMPACRDARRPGALPARRRRLQVGQPRTRIAAAVAPGRLALLALLPCRRHCTGCLR